jgi:hypothetical protein
MWITLKEAREKLKDYYAETYVRVYYKKLFKNCGIKWRLTAPRIIQVDAMSVENYKKKRRG